jgi:hypothetical protein
MGTTCEVCSARVGELRRGRCWGCYLRWVDARPVGVGAACTVCGERRRELLRLIELHGRSHSMCHNCAARTLRLMPTPRSVEALREQLERDRRQSERRWGEVDHRIFPRERRAGERRAGEREEIIWLDDDAILEVIEAEAEPGDATRIHNPETPSVASLLLELRR